jgi:predicted nucleotidyltransferase
MIDLLTNSRIRRRIILLLVYNQNREFYLSEIAKIVKTSPGTAQRELNRLLRNDFIVFKKKANLNFYSLNRHYSLLNEIESIVKKTFGAEVELKKELSRIKGISYAFLFGSYVKGGFKSDSDIDLFVIGEMDEDRVFQAVQKMEGTIGREINYHIATGEEFLEKVKINYFHKVIAKNVMLLIGDEDGFRRIVK